MARSPIRRSLALAVGVTLTGVTFATAPVQAQSRTLRGSPASIDRMYRQALDHDLRFYETPKGVREAVAEGRFDTLRGNGDYIVHAVSFPYVIGATRIFVERLAQQYHDECGEQLVVTSAIRPETRQPANSADHSVHPTGMAVDLRKPSGRCLRWLRNTLASLEETGILEATEEHHPAHFHVAVFPQPYANYLSGLQANRVAAAAAELPKDRVEPERPSARNASVRSYQVRSGDTLWHLARRYKTSVKQLKSLNDLSTSRLQPGQKLLVPAGS